MTIPIHKLLKSANQIDARLKASRKVTLIPGEDGQATIVDEPSKKKSKKTKAAAPDTSS